MLRSLIHVLKHLLVKKLDGRGKPLKRTTLAEGACPTIRDPDTFVEKVRKAPTKRLPLSTPARKVASSTSKDHSYSGAKPGIKEKSKVEELELLVEGLKNDMKGLQDENVLLRHKVDKHEALWASEQNEVICGFKSKTTWSDPVIVLCAELRFLGGTTAYEHLRNVWHLPIPAIRTLNDRLKLLKIQPGLSPDCAQLAEIKAKKLDDDDKHAVLVIDELSTQPKLEWDTSNKCVSGFITLPETDADIPLDSQGKFEYAHKS